MTWLEAIVLGIVQGLTEFLPVSSSGHLELVKYFFSYSLSASESLQITLVLHLATVFSTLIYFRKSIISLFKGCFLGNKEDLLYLLRIIISMFPAAFVGVFFNDEIELLFSGNILLVGAALSITGLFLLYSDRVKETKKKVKTFTAFFLGLAQAFAILPGISRSGATIATGIALKIDRKRVAQFSFLMVVPLILGKVVKDSIEGSFVSLNDTNLTAIILGFLSAFFVGLLACRLMVKLVTNSKLKYFGYYCLVIGIVVITFFSNFS